MFDIFKSVDEFLGQFSEEEKKQVVAQKIKDQVHLKQLLTILSKKKLENLLPIRKQMVLCEKDCYKNINIDNKFQVDKDIAEELRDCKTKCKIPKTDLIHFLDNINYLSENKMKMCTKSCKQKISDESKNGSSKEEVYDECMWICYNKLDRRYKEYWLDQRNDIVSRHYFKSMQELSNNFSQQQ